MVKKIRLSAKIVTKGHGRTAHTPKGSVHEEDEIVVNIFFNMGAPQYRRSGCLWPTQTPLGPDEPGPDELSGRLGGLPQDSSDLDTSTSSARKSLLMSIWSFQCQNPSHLVALFVLPTSL